MPYAIVPIADVPGIDERWSSVTQGVWPEYNVHGDVVAPLWPRLAEDFPDLQFALVETESGDLAGRGFAIPCAWDGSERGLPAGFDGLFEHAFALREPAATPDTLSAAAIAIRPEHQGRGLAAGMIEHMRTLARRAGLRALVAPLRPTWKERYPLAPIERYARWMRPDGTPFDPWMRLHVRLGGRIVRPEPRSLRITGTVGEWERWTGMAFPESGEYVFPHGLAPLALDREADVGRYFEPNVWVEHPLEGAVRERT